MKKPMSSSMSEGRMERIVEGEGEDRWERMRLAWVWEGSQRRIRERLKKQSVDEKKRQGWGGKNERTTRAHFSILLVIPLKLSSSVESVVDVNTLEQRLEVDLDLLVVQHVD